MQINTTLLTYDEKEYLDELKDYQEIAKSRIEYFSDDTSEKSLINDFVLSRWKCDLRQVNNEINALNFLAQCRAIAILNFCHTGK